MPRRRRLLMWSLLAAAFLLVNFHRTATGVLASSLAVAFDTSGTELGVLHSSFFYIYAALQLPAGLLVDRYGSRRAATVSLVVMTVGVGWFATAGSFPAAFLARGLIGLGGSTIYIATLAFLASWFRPDAYATMTGLTIAASGIGGVLATTPLAYTIDAVGWRSSILAAGVVGGLLAGAVWAVVRDSPPSEAVDRDPPTASAVLADGLLGRVFENILTNAVVHNDTDRPRVAVTARETPLSATGEPPAAPPGEGGDDTEASGETAAGVTVSVADNGPGVPPEKRDAILEKGVSELDEPSNGFGLYLVKQMVRSYDGTLEITDASEAPDDVLVPDEERGAVFSVTLPQA